MNFGPRVLWCAAGLQQFDPGPIDAALLADNTTARAPEARPGQALADYLPVWAPSFSEYRLVDEGGQAAVYSHYSWSNSPTAHSPEEVLLGWGIEFAVNLYNDDLVGFRPDCANPFNDLAFWAKHPGLTYSAYNSGFSTGNLGIYFDGNLFRDSCDRLSMTMGVGFPRVIAEYALESYDLQFIVRANFGSEPVNVVSSGFQVVENNCTGAPNSDCMGLYEAEYPGAGGNLGTTLGMSRGWSTPGLCYSYLTDYADPFPGTC